ncbi:fructose-specific PTS transporter subunit EIIC [Faecalibacillus intestinalis]|uniref:Fructose-specific PTS transporter subunit EIIC n=1 Tax=Faecalibacillus intestinalis TaxID=1982626 RepID=A0AAP2UFZ7_9FIRM|nr:fructose-specific PTS transporter subunit EIIC [Faecalibacillus intestinalis]MCB8593104.1 fructose-specific PTS transporter subunit EIIC [Faecalibacillus intestinalis]MCB8613181.1 fructose-specific PTS transporter subunit EIIC [Faecalibacillus intestinalis]MCG4681818.1 fructose-specific PTS transporter subunit EIIC [Faecalibacillus intestinalis]MCG4714562.1 fructose-specific PTS transporter subunit EIIC [Faecalibacillus intestinalis]MCG4755805.1 fructose-specific PTS transporter subunit EII
MKITELLDINSIDLNPQISNKEEAIDHLVNLLDQSGKLNDKEIYKESVLNREAQSTTGIGDGVAIPHGQSEGVKTAGLSAMVVKEGLDFKSLDGQPTYLFFMIGAPKDSGGAHLQALAQLSTLLMEEDFRNALINASSKEEFLQLIDAKENKKEEVKEVIHPAVLAVTACPTGIAHTFMAAKALQQAGEALNISIKVETNGQEGVKNQLTQEDIEHCKAIIVAADKKVEMARFEGKKVIQVPVRDGISKAQELVEKANNGDGEIYHHEEKKEKQNIIRLFYKHLMNGISHALPFLVTSGVLYGILYLFKDQVLTNQLLILTSNVQQLISIMIIPIISAYIADSIADRPGMLSGFAGGLIVCQGISITSISTSSPSLLAGIIAGFLAGFVSLMLRKLFSYLPQCLKGIEASLFHPIISTIIVTLLMFYLNSYLYIGHTYILNYVSLVESQMSTKVLFGFVLGMMMAIDNGGPINKTAYVFSIGMLMSYDYYPMAAVMAGGMIPPFVIALTATLFKDRFEVRNDALMNYINGISFISEGAIPFIQKESQIILPACCLSAGLAGALSMYFNCSIASPHGGLFLIWMVQNPISYLSLIVCSTLVGTILLILFTKLKKES